MVMSEEPELFLRLEKSPWSHSGSGTVAFTLEMPRLRVPS